MLWGGRQFQALIVLTEKKCFLKSCAENWLFTFKACPRVLGSLRVKKWSNSQDDNLHAILNICRRSAVTRRLFRLLSCKRLSLSEYEQWRTVETLLVTRRWTRSNLSISRMRYGLQTEEAYSKWGLTKALYNCKKIAGERLTKDLLNEARTPSAFLTTLEICPLQLRSLLMRMPRSRSPEDSCKGKLHVETE